MVSKTTLKRNNIAGHVDHLISRIIIEPQQSRQDGTIDKKIGRWMEQNKKSRNGPMHMWTIDFRSGAKCFLWGKGNLSAHSAATIR